MQTNMRTNTHVKHVKLEPNKQNVTVTIFAWFGSVRMSVLVCRSWNELRRWSTSGEKGRTARQRGVRGESNKWFLGLRGRKKGNICAVLRGANTERWLWCSAELRVQRREGDMDTHILTAYWELPTTHELTNGITVKSVCPESCEEALIRESNNLKLNIIKEEVGARR